MWSYIIYPYSDKGKQLFLIAFFLFFSLMLGESLIDLTRFYAVAVPSFPRTYESGAFKPVKAGLS